MGYIIFRTLVGKAYVSNISKCPSEWKLRLFSTLLTVVNASVLIEYLYSKWFVQFFLVWNKFGEFEGSVIYMTSPHYAILVGFCMVNTIWSLRIARAGKDPVFLCMGGFFVVALLFILFCYAVDLVQFITIKYAG